MKTIYMLCLFCLGMTLTSYGQDFHMPKPSPTTTIHQGFSTSFIALQYSRPSLKNRQMLGHLVPYGSVWRTGANQATTITFGEEVSFGNKTIKAGKYALYTIPGKEKWTIIVNSGVKYRSEEHTSELQS